MADQADLDLDMQLMAAAEALDLTLAKQLLEKGADAKFIHDPPGIWGSCSKKGPLHMAIKMQPRKTKALLESEFQLKLEDWKELVKLLVEAGADVNGKTVDYNWREWTPFEKILPSAMEDPALLGLFLSAGANPNTKRVNHVHSMRTDGESVSFVLHDAVRTCSLEIVSTLLAARADVNAVSWEQFHNERGFNCNRAETALHQASRQKGKEGLAMCSLLLSHGAHVNILREDLEHVSSDVQSPTDDPRGPGFVSSVVCVPMQETALHIAIAAKNVELVALLVCAGADLSCSRLRGSESSSCVELCQGDEALLQALDAEWSPKTHRHFSSEIKAQVVATLMAAKRQQWPLNTPLLHRICAFIATPVVVQPTAAVRARA